ncbi:MAG: glycoside hydrolase family protein [Phycisphaerae bacterium]
MFSRITVAILSPLLLLALAANAQEPTTQASTGPSMKDSILPTPKNAGFSMPDYYLWCSSVIKVGDTYHMFASRWPKDKQMAGWVSESECVHATSPTLLGPYTFQEVVLQKRPDAWDARRVHNVKIVQTHGDHPTYVIFYIAGVNDTGYAYADSVNGPWTRSDHAVIPASNPAILIRPDNSVYAFCRLRDKQKVNRGVAFTAPTFEGPYTAIQNGDNLLPNNAQLEDPCIWWANDQYNILLNDWNSRATGIFKAGAQYFSKDGIHYTLVSHEPVFTKTVEFDDGSSETFARRERPFVYVNDKGEAEAIFTACLPRNNSAPSRIIAQPVNNYVPTNHE